MEGAELLAKIRHVASRLLTVISDTHPYWTTPFSQKLLGEDPVVQQTISRALASTCGVAWDVELCMFTDATTDIVPLAMSLNQISDPAQSEQSAYDKATAFVKRLSVRGISSKSTSHDERPSWLEVDQTASVAPSVSSNTTSGRKRGSSVVQREGKPILGLTHSEKRLEGEDNKCDLVVTKVKGGSVCAMAGADEGDKMVSWINVTQKSDATRLTSRDTLIECYNTANVGDSILLSVVSKDGHHKNIEFQLGHSFDQQSTSTRTEEHTTTVTHSIPLPSERSQQEADNAALIGKLYRTIEEQKVTITLRQTRIEELESQLDGIKKNAARENADLTDLETELKNTLKEKAILLEQITELEAEVKRLERLRTQEPNRTEINVKVQELTQTVVEVTEQSDQLKKENGTKEKRIEELEEIIKIIQTRAAKESQELESLRKETQQLKGTLRVQEELCEELKIQNSNSLNSLTEQITKKTEIITTLEIALRESNPGDVEVLQRENQRLKILSSKQDEMLEEQANAKSHSLRNLTEELTKKNELIGKLETAIQEIEETRTNENNELHQEIRHLRQAQTDSSRQLTNKDTEIMKLGSQIKQYESEASIRQMSGNEQVRNLEMEVKQLVSTKDSLTNTSTEKDGTIRELQDVITSYKQKLSKAEDEISKAEDEVIMMKGKHADLMTQISNQDASLLSLRSAAAESQQLSDDKNMLQIQVEKLNLELADAAKDNLDLKQTISKKESQLSSLRDELASVEQHGLEGARLKNQVHALNREVDDLQMTKQMLEQKVTDRDTKIRKLANEIEELESKAQSHRDISRKLQQRDDELELMQQHEHDQSVRLSDRDKQIRALRDELQDLSDTYSTEKREAHRKITHLTEEMKMMEEKVDESNVRNTDRESLIKTLKEQLSGQRDDMDRHLTFDKRDIARQLQQTQDANGELQRSNAELQQRLVDKEAAVQSLKEDVAKQVEECDQAYADLKEVQQQAASAQDEVTYLENETAELQRKITEQATALASVERLQKESIPEAEFQELQRKLEGAQDGLIERDTQIATLMDRLKTVQQTLDVEQQEHQMKITLVHDELGTSASQLRELKAAFKEKDILVKQISESEKEKSSQVGVLQRQLQHLEAELTAQKNLNTELQSVLSDKECIISNIKEKSTDFKREAEQRLSLDKKDVQRKINQLQADVEMLDKQKSELSQHLHSRDSSITSLRDQVLNLKKTNAETEVKLREMQLQNNKIIPADDEEIAALKAQKVALETTLRAKEAQIKQLEAIVQHRKPDSEHSDNALKEQIKTLESSLQWKDTQMDSLRSRLQEATQHSNAQQKHIDQLNDTLTALNKRLEAKDRIDGPLPSWGVHPKDSPKASTISTTLNNTNTVNSTNITSINTTNNPKSPNNTSRAETPVKDRHIETLHGRCSEINTAFASLQQECGQLRTLLTDEFAQNVDNQTIQKWQCWFQTNLHQQDDLIKKLQQAVEHSSNAKASKKEDSTSSPNISNISIAQSSVSSPAVSSSGTPQATGYSHGRGHGVKITQHTSHNHKFHPTPPRSRSSTHTPPKARSNSASSTSIKYNNQTTSPPAISSLLKHEENKLTDRHHYRSHSSSAAHETRKEVRFLPRPTDPPTTLNMMIASPRKSAHTNSPLPNKRIDRSLFTSNSDRTCTSPRDVERVYSCVTQRFTDPSIRTPHSHTHHESFSQSHARSLSPPSSIKGAGTSHQYTHMSHR